MPGGHDRRSFFRELLRGATRAAGELGALRDSAADVAETPWEPGLPSVPEELPSPVPAGAVERPATIDDVRRLCAELDRDAWADEAASLARPSIRLTQSDEGRSWLGGAPIAPSPFEWPSWDGEKLTFLAHLRLDEMPQSALPRDGALLVFFALDLGPSGLKPSDADACRVVHVPDGTGNRVDREHGLPEVSVTTSVELTLPVEPASFELDAWELETWTDLRERLALFQGVELEERSADYHALHRMLGYPDTFADGMELDAQLLSHGIDLEEEPYAHPRYDELASGATEWRLLLQLSSDDEAGIALGYYERLFVWIRDADLRAARFDGVRAFVR